MPEKTLKTALLIGATGMIGKQVLQKLLNAPDYSEIRVLTRRPLQIRSEKLTEIIFDFDQPDASMVKADDVFCCLGTTIKKAGSQEAFKKVDFEYPLTVGRLARENGAEKYIIVTAMGADPKSFVFYNRVKGEVQEALVSLNFDALHIVQPSLLLGHREESRFGEKAGEFVMKIIGPLLIGGLKKYRAIESSKVATAMIELARKPGKGIFIHDSGDLQGYQV